MGAPSSHGSMRSPCAGDDMRHMSSTLLTGVVWWLGSCCTPHAWAFRCLVSAIRPVACTGLSRGGIPIIFQGQSSVCTNVYTIELLVAFAQSSSVRSAAVVSPASESITYHTPLPSCSLMHLMCGVNPSFMVHATRNAVVPCGAAFIRLSFVHCAAPFDRVSSAGVGVTCLYIYLDIPMALNGPLVLLPTMAILKVSCPGHMCGPGASSSLRRVYTSPPDRVRPPIAMLMAWTQHRLPCCFS